MLSYSCRKIFIEKFQIFFAGQISDLADKLETWDGGSGRTCSSSSIPSAAAYAAMPSSGGGGGHGGVTPGVGGSGGGLDSADKKTEDKLMKATRDACKITTEVLNGIMTQVIKDKLFNHQKKLTATVENMATT